VAEPHSPSSKYYITFCHFPFTKENRKRVDEAIHCIMDVEYKNCLQSWAKIKKEVVGNAGKRKDFIARLKSELARS